MATQCLESILDFSLFLFDGRVPLLLENSTIRCLVIFLFFFPSLKLDLSYSPMYIKVHRTTCAEFKGKEPLLKPPPPKKKVMAKLSAILIFMLSFLTLETESSVTIGEHYCLNSSTFTLNGTYGANLNLLLESLSSHANSSIGYFNTSIGKPSDADAVYGRFLCKGDVSKEVCMECVNDATVRTKEKCPMVKAAILWYDECMLQYSYSNFSPTTDDVPILGGYNTQNVDYPTEFMNLLEKTMKQLVTRAADRSDKKYASKEAPVKVYSDTTLYTFAQCRPDLSAAQCEDCLQNVTLILQTNQTGKVGGRILRPSCFARFGLSPFYTVERKRHFSARLAIGITSATSAIGLICVVLWFALKRERNKRNNVEEDPIGKK